MEKYEILNQLGDGTFGSVAKAVSKKTGQLVAIKKMKQKYYSWEECVKLPEVDVVRRIHGHPNIVKLREVIRENNELFFVFEYMDGDLLGVIKKAKQAQRPEDAATSPAIPYPKIKSYVRQILQSLAYLHKRGYFHRDMKPENLLVRRDGQEDLVKLADFGLVKECRARPPFTDYVSTRWYRAPELLLQDRSYNSPVDIWAVGCIMAELITTRPLFPGSNEVDQLFKTMTILGTPTEKTWPGGMALARKIRYTFPNIQGTGLKRVFPAHVPSQAIDLIAQMLTYDPHERPTAEQCLQHPFFSVGVDEVNGPSTAAIDQLASAAKKFQQNPQSAPAVMQGLQAHNFNGTNGSKAETPKRSSVTTADVGSAPSPQKYFMLKNAQLSVDKGSTGSKHENSTKPIVAPGLGLANVRKSSLKPSGTTNESNPSNATATEKPSDLDSLMQELAIEVSTLGIDASKQKNADVAPVNGNNGTKPRSSISSSDPVAALLGTSRYKRSSVGSLKVSPQSGANPAPRQETKNVNTSMFSPSQSVSPSIKALLAKRKTSGFSFQ